MTLRQAVCLVVLAALGLGRPLFGWGAASSETYYHFLHARLAEQAGDIATALKEYQHIIRLDPGALEVHRDLAKLYLRMGRVDEALRSAETAQTLVPEDPSSLLFVGGLRLLKGESATAIAAYEKALTLDPANRDALVHLGMAYTETDPKKAITYFRRSLTVEPGSAEVHYRLGLAYQRAGQAREAETAFQQALAIAPELLTSQLALAELYEVQASTPLAIEAYQRCSTLNPRNPALFLRMGSLHERTGEFDQAERALLKAATLLPKDPSIQFWLARVAEEQQGWKKAARYAQRAYTLSGDVQFVPLLAYYLTQSGHIRRAVTHLQRALQAAPQRADVAFFLGVGYLDLHWYRHAARAFEAALAANEQFHQARFQLGAVYDRLGQCDAAMAQMEQVVAHEPNNAPALNYLGYSYAERGIRLDEAERLLRQAVTLDPANGAFLDSLGWVHYRQHRLPQAVEELTRATVLLHDPVIWEHLGDIHWASTQPVEAYLAWRQALNLAPRQRSLKRKLHQVERAVPRPLLERQSLRVAAGNLARLNDLSGFFTVTGRFPRRRWQAHAAVHFRSPHHLRLTWVTPLGGPPAVMLFQDGRLVKGPSQGEWSRERLEAWAERFTAFLSGKVLAEVAQSSSTPSVQGHQLVYTSSHGVVSVDRHGAVVTRWEWRESGGAGTGGLTLSRYRRLGGIWIPHRLVLALPKEPLELQIEMSHLKVNQGLSDRLFDLQSAPPVTPSP